MSQAEQETGAETRSFEADVARLLELMVHSVYSTRDVFLRELVSNAADACEKLRHLSLTDPSVLGDDPKLSIRIVADKDAGTLAIADNGIGMTREELVENLGTIAKSGTRAFLEAAEGARDKGALIGQFGVGFYSAFMVASEVTVTSRAAGSDAAHRWRSDGTGSFTVEEVDAAEAPARGTVVHLALRDDAKDFADEATVERTIRHYSAHVPVPVTFEKAGEDVRRELVDGTALWTRPKGDIEAGEYAEFYRFVSNNFDEPALTVHYRAEGRQEYTVLLFVPSMPPFDLFDPDRKGRVRLYVRRVFITDEAEVLPSWLRFVRGVVDSADLPLNLSREMLQTNPLLEAIRKAVTNRVLSELKKLSENDADTYLKVWQAFGPVIKEGLYESAEKRDEIYPICRFHTTTAPDGWRSLAEVVADMRENQTAIYYAAGDDVERLKTSPQLEGFAARGVEVLLLTDPVDAFWVQTALGFEGKPFKSVTQGTADLDAIPLLEETTQADEAAKASDVATLAALVKQTLGDRVSEVRPSERLATSPACLVAPAMGPDRQMERLFARQRGGLAGAGTAPILEINPRHPLVKALAAKAAAGGAAERVADASFLLLGSAEILEGEAVSDPVAFNARLVAAMTALVGDASAAAPETAAPDGEAEEAPPAATGTA